MASFLRKKSLMLIMIILAGTMLYLFSRPTQAVEGYYSYDVKTGSWVWMPGVWTPTARERRTMRSVTISVHGLPADVATNIYVDGKPAGSMRDSESRTFIVTKREGHTFCVDEEVRGASYTYEGFTVSTRYLCPGKCWSVEPVEKKQVCEYVPVCTWVCYPCPTEPLCTPPCPPCAPCEYVCYTDYRCHYEEEIVGPQSYTFEYYAEHQMVVSNIHGDNVNEWVKDGSTVSFFAKEVVPIRDESSVKERDVFQYWSVNGQPNENNAITLLVNKPYVAKAYYGKEIEYRVRVDSEYGHPAMDKPNGWYRKGEDATVSVEPEIPLEGWKGAWGGKRVFTAWYSGEGLESRSPTYVFTVEEPKNLRAEWKIDESKPMMYLYILITVVVAAIVALIVFLLYWTGRILRRTGLRPPLETAEPPPEGEARRRPRRKPATPA